MSFCCPLCAGTTARALYTPLVQCTGCGLVCTDQTLVAAPAPDLYSESYFTERNAYLAQAETFQAAFGQLLDLADARKPRSRLLDVGCGPGLLLRLARERGYAVKGCDVSPWATQYAREMGLEVATGELAAANYAAGEFDAVIINHTLEHVPAPRRMLEDTHRLLAPGGIVVVGVPNFGSLMAQLMRERWAGLLPDQHLWHFTPQTLGLILARAGFEVEQISVEPYVHRHPNWLKARVLQVLGWTAERLGRGDSMIAVAWKPGAQVREA